LESNSLNVLAALDAVDETVGFVNELEVEGEAGKGEEEGNGEGEAGGVKTKGSLDGTPNPVKPANLDGCVPSEADGELVTEAPDLFGSGFNFLVANTASSAFFMPISSS
jgi:hypothetical protein